MQQSVEIFFCYAHEDESLRQGIEKQLRVLRRQGFVSLWHDRNISAGTEWQREINEQLEAAQIILLLVSPDFIDSDYCYSTEMKRAMERHEQRDVCVIPVILRPVYWQAAPFGNLQVLPTGAKPISGWSSLDEAFFDVAEGIRKTVEKLRNRENTSPSANSLYTPYPVAKPTRFRLPNVLQKHSRSALVMFFTLLCLGLLIGGDRVWLLVAQQNQLYAYLTATDAANAYWAATAKEVQFGFDPAHTRWNRYEQVINTTNVTRLAPLWAYQTGGLVASSPTVANSLVYVGSEDGKFYAFDATCHSTCQPLWLYQTDDKIESSPAVSNGVVYVGSFDGKLYAFDATCRTACQPLWSYQTGNGIFSSPAVANSLVYVGSGAGFYAFDATCRNACQPLWSYQTGKPFGSSPAVANGIVYVGSDNGKFYAFDAACRSTCLPLWSYQTGKSSTGAIGIFSSPAVANNVVYIGSDDGKLYAFDSTCRNACQPLWSYQIGNFVLSSPTVANGTVYVGTDDHVFYALGPST